ncbi:MAG: alanine--tRNA ligase, partial [Proteobacteria bacterium]|nr:alanine--tRNA ligase [Pseudomonadota bacterium]
VGDGIMPENVGRGYVLRRILRRAVRHGRMIGLTKPFLHDVTGRVVELMGRAYPELMDGASYIKKVIQSEEERFSETLDNGLKLLSDEMDRLRDSEGRIISGEVAFRLYDTYGFPLDLVEDVGRENGFTVDVAGFDQAMDTQRAQSRASWKGSGETAVPAPISDLTASGFTTEFLGYQGLTAESELVLLMKDGDKADQAGAGDAVDLVFARTPFYGESGGQMGDTGRVRSEGAEVEITDTLRFPGGIVVHRGRVASGEIRPGLSFKLEVAEALRRDTMGNHTATHLLHKVLREELGDHVKQSGSMVSPDRLRFDFTHFEQVPQELLERIELRINEKVRENLPVGVSVMSHDEALQTGAVALFEERYGDEVRVVSVGDFSMELCGGTHAERTGDIGAFLIVSEASVAAGVRRIEALTGRGAVEAILTERRLLKDVAERLKTSTSDAPERLDRVLSRQKELDREIERIKQKAAAGQSDEVLDRIEEIGGVKVLAARVKVEDPKALREMGDRLKDRIGSGLIALGAENKGKAVLLVIVTPDLQGRFHAGDMIKAMAREVGGGGGGRPDMAQAGGPDPEKLDQALARVRELAAGK